MTEEKRRRRHRWFLHPILRAKMQEAVETQAGGKGEEEEVDLTLAELEEPMAK